MSDTSRQLRDLLDAAVGDPPHTVTVQAVRRRVARRRIIESVAAVLVAVLVAGVGVAVATQAHGSGVANGPRPAAGAPRYYVQQQFGTGPAASTVVRATATGKVTATVRCQPGTSLVQRAIAAATRRTFFLACQTHTGPRGKQVITGSRIYRFHLTAAGRIAGYSLVPGGSLGGLSAGEVTAAANGSEIAVGTLPAGHVSPSESADIMVINTRTGARAVWHSSPAVPGKMALAAGDLSLTADGRELVYLGTPRCIAGHCQPTGNGQEVRALRPAAAGGQLSSSRLLVRQATLGRLASTYLDGAVVSADGSSVDVLKMLSPGQGPTTVSVIKVSAATGRPVRVLYRVTTGNGFSFQTFSSDPSRGYLILVAGPPGGTIPNGYIYHRHLVPLAPADGSNVSYETW
ncbi:MAG TPA: hypothetical protein VIK57_21440 [Streptosporangiaceae bacterium]